MPVGSVYVDAIRWLNVGRAGAIIAMVALLVALATWLTTRRYVREAKRQAAAAEDQAKAAAAQAEAAKQGVVAAEQQAKAAREQVFIAEQAVEVAREQTRMAQEQVILAVRQLELAERVRLEEARAFVFADLRSDMLQPQLLVLAVHNQGRTVARNVQVIFDPPLKASPETDPIEKWHVSTLAPGAQMVRGITSGRIFFNSGIERERQPVKVTAEDASGPLEPLTYEIDLKALGEVLAAGKTIYHVVEELEKVRKALGKIAENTTPEEPA